MPGGAQDDGQCIAVTHVRTSPPNRLPFRDYLLRIPIVSYRIAALIDLGLRNPVDAFLSQRHLA